MSRTVSVILPVYNGEKYIKEAITSVLLQPCKDIDVVVVNDGSTDGTESILKEVSQENPKVTVINTPNGGVSKARNIGIEYCLKENSKYLAFLDADDVWCKGFYDEELRQYLQDHSPDLISFNHYAADQDLSCGKKINARKIENNGKLNQYPIHFCAYLYAAEILKQYEVRFPVGVKQSEDAIFFYQFASLSKHGIYFDKPMFIYRSNKYSVSHQENGAKEFYLNRLIPAWGTCRKELEKFKKQGYPVTDSDMIVSKVYENQASK